MKTTDLEIPARYQWAAEELQRVVKEIETAFFERPVPAGQPRHFDEACDLFNPVRKTITNLLLAIGDLNLNVFANAAATRDGVRKSVAAVEDCIQELTAVFHAIWRKPLDPAIAEAQPYFSAIPETLLKRCHALFRNLIDLVSLDSAAWRSQDRTAVTMSLNLDVGEEIGHLESWLTKMRGQRSRDGDSCWLWAAAGLILGLWID